MAEPDPDPDAVEPAVEPPVEPPDEAADEPVEEVVALDPDDVQAATPSVPATSNAVRAVVVWLGDPTLRA